MISDLKFWFDLEKCLIGGYWVVFFSGGMLLLIDLLIGVEIGVIVCGMVDDIDVVVVVVEIVWVGVWGKIIVVECGCILMCFGQLVQECVEDFVWLEVIDVGKLLKQVWVDVVVFVCYMEFYGGVVDKLYGEMIFYFDGYMVYILCELYGVIGYIVFWNYLMQIVGCLVGVVLVIGNICVLKFVEDVCLMVLVFVDLVKIVGLLDGVFNVVLGLGVEVGVVFVGYLGVQYISFIGLVVIGVQIQMVVVCNVVFVMLELGGKFFQFVFDDVDFEVVLLFLVNVGIQNVGQICFVFFCILVQCGVYEVVVEKMVVCYKVLKVGFVLNDFDVGFLILVKQQGIVISFIDCGDDLDKVVEGIFDVVFEGGSYIKLILFVGVLVGYVFVWDEIFGLVQVIILFDDEEEVIVIVNGMDYGFVVGIWSWDGVCQMWLVK